MKKLKLTLIFALIILSVSGCGEQPDENAEINNTSQNEVENQYDKKVIKSQSVSDDIASYTEVVSYVGDCDGDGSDETVVLSTEAERDSNGEFLWNDGQNWALYVKKSSNDVYVLYDGYVQAGNVHFDISDYYMSDGVKPVIFATVSTGAGLTIKTYSYSNADSGYVESTVYDTRDIAEGGINRRFTSVPELIK